MRCRMESPSDEAMRCRFAARELADVLKSDFHLTLHPALATIPTITEIGMASLVPRADQGVKVVPVGNGKLGLEVAGTCSRTARTG